MPARRVNRLRQLLALAQRNPRLRHQLVARFPQVAALLNRMHDAAAPRTVPSAQALARMNLPRVGRAREADIGEQIAQREVQYFDQTARASGIPAPVVNLVENLVGGVLSPGLSGGVTPLEARYIDAGATPIERALRTADVEGRTGSKQLLRNGMYITVGGRGRGGPGWDDLMDEATNE